MSSLMKPFVVIDTETTGLNVHQGAKPFAYVITFDPNELNLKTSEDDYILDKLGTRTIVTRNIEVAKLVCENTDLMKVAHNLKFDKLMMLTKGVEFKGLSVCTMIAKFLLDENTPKNLDYCAKTYLSDLGIEKMSSELDNWFEARKIKKDDRRYDQVPWDLMKRYAGMDGLTTYFLWKKFRPALIKQNLEPLFWQEMVLTDELIKTEIRGYPIDLEYIERCKILLLAKATEAEERCFQRTGYEFNLDSGREIARYLQDEGIELPLTDKGNIKTSKDIIEKVDHPIIEDILEYRHSTKMISTYFDSFLKYQVGGILHGSFDQTGAIHGRCSCKNPALQTIPSKDNDTMIRGCFINREGYTIFPIDWKQQEYRVFLSYAQETDMINAINNCNADYHQLIMDEIPQLDTRKKAKTYNFMLIYGGGVGAIADALGVTFVQAQRLKRQFFERFKNVRRFMDLVEQTVKNRGFIFNKYGRRRRLTRKETYKAVNSLVCGCCADYNKSKWIEVSRYIKPYGGTVILQVHDELHCEVPNDRLDLVPGICDIMSSSEGIFSCKMDVDPCIITTNWLEKKDFDLKTLKPIYEL